MPLLAICYLFVVFFCAGNIKFATNLQTRLVLGESLLGSISHSDVRKYIRVYTKCLPHHLAANKINWHLAEIAVNDCVLCGAAVHTLATNGVLRGVKGFMGFRWWSFVVFFLLCFRMQIKCIVHK